MNKKIYLILFALFLSITFYFSISYATDNSTMVDDIRNVVGGAENAIENAGNGIMNGTKNIINDGQNVMENISTGINSGMQNFSNNMQNKENRIMGGLTSDNNNDYSATRTATNTTGTFLGMDPTMWTWIIMAIVGVAIIALVWWYAKQNDNSYNE